MVDNILSQNFLELVKIMNRLRKECPWDNKQTFSTLRNFTIEELYELIDDIDSNNIEGMKEELGDLLFHIIFYAEIANETNQFNLAEIIEKVNKKLISRHPHVFGDTQVKDDNEVKENWEKIKLKEGRKSMLSGVPNALPAINKALLIQEKAKQVGFEWENPLEVIQKIQEELNELQEAIQSKNRVHIEEELGDVFFSLINFSRYIQINPDKALNKINHTFKERFQLMEILASEKKTTLSEMSMVDKNELWDEAKKILKNKK